MLEKLIRTVAVPAVVLAVVLAAPAQGQLSGGDGYLFGVPHGQVGIRLGFARPGASSDLFAESFDSLSLSRNSFDAPDVGLDIGLRIAPRLDLTLSADYSGRKAKSEYRYFYDNNQQPIEQTTTFTRIPLTAGLKLYLLPRGRSVGSLAWIPSTVVPWVGAATGMSYYRYVQEGDFIGPGATMPIYTDRLESSGWGFATQASGGVDINLSTRSAITADVRYTHAAADLNRSTFSGYDKLDLSGVSFALGLTFRL